MHKKKHNNLVIAIIALLGFIARSTVRVQLFGNRSLVLFFIEIYVGNPPIRQRIHVDTGSSLTTIKCSDCKVCVDKKATNYNQLSSFTSKRLSCESRSPICDESCKMSNNDGYCHFFTTYGDGTTVIGNLLEDQMRFSQIDTPFNAQFGCMSYQKEFYQANLDGLLGISPNFKQNILNKWFDQRGGQHQFSVCLGENGGYIDIGQDKQEYNYQAVLEYQLIQQIFTVNGQLSIAVAQDEIRIDHNSYEVLLIDTGSTYCHFPSQIFNFISSKLFQVCQNYEKGCIISTGSMCMGIKLSSASNQEIYEELNHIFPTIDIKIDGHIFPWPPSQYIFLVHRENQSNIGYQVCFAFRSSEKLSNNVFILGMYWMIGKRFKFNLKEQTISILSNQSCKYTSLQIAAQSKWPTAFNNFISFVQEYMFALVIIFIFLVVIFKDPIIKCGSGILPFLRRIPPFIVRLWRFVCRPRQSKQKKKPARGNQGRRTSGNKKKQKKVSPPKAIQLSSQSQQIQTSTIQQT